jgi:hypothetical protein
MKRPRRPVGDDETARRGWGWGATKAAATGGYHKEPEGRHGLR